MSNPKNNIINEAEANPFIKGLRKHFSEHGKNFNEFLCYTYHQRTGTECSVHAAKGGKYTKKKIECDGQLAQLLAMHLQSKHISGARLKKLLANLTKEHVENDTQ